MCCTYLVLEIAAQNSTRMHAGGVACIYDLKRRIFCTELGMKMIIPSTTCVRRSALPEILEFSGKHREVGLHKLHPVIWNPQNPFS